jgi:xylulokinase
MLQSSFFKNVSTKHVISYISFSGQMHSLVALDKNDKVIRPAIMWCDQRTHKQCIEVIGKTQMKKFIYLIISLR